jgi:transcriptional regulatory protein AMDR
MWNPTNFLSGHAACVNCHLRKVKCDAQKRGFPCSNCISSRRPHCRVHEKKKRSLHRPVDNPVPIRPQVLETSTQNAASIAAVTSPVESTLSPETSSPNQSVHVDSVSTARELDRSGFKRHLVEFIDQADMAHRSIQKGVRITYVGKDVSNINFLVRQREGQEDETVYHFPSDEIAHQYITHEPERMPREAFVLPEKAFADELVEAYFTKINPGCPIVDEDIFMGQYRSRNPADPPSLLVLQAILLVGAHVSRERPDRDTLKATFFRRAKMLFDARLEKNRDVVVQAALLLTWHSDGAEDIGANAWYWVGIAARIATGLGMHRDAGSSTLINHDLRTWRRTWWILVQFDVMVALSHGRPQAM